MQLPGASVSLRQDCGGSKSAAAVPQTTEQNPSMATSEYDDKTIIPQPADKDTRWYTTIERIRDRLPSLAGQAGNFLKVSADETGCEWIAGGSGGTVSFADITGNPADNPALNSVLTKKADVSASGTVPFTIGCDETGLFVDF